MPANLTPEYRAAEAAFRQARDPGQRLEWLREMLRVIPKHKGTDHLQGDIKRRIKELSAEISDPRRAGPTGAGAVIRPEGAAQSRCSDRRTRASRRSTGVSRAPRRMSRHTDSRPGIPSRG